MSSEISNTAQELAMDSPYNMLPPQPFSGSIWHFFLQGSLQSLVATGLGLRDKHRSGRDWICLETHTKFNGFEASGWKMINMLKMILHDWNQRIEADFSSSEPSVAADRLSRRRLLSGPATIMHNTEHSFNHLHWLLPALYIFVQVHAMLTASNLKSNMSRKYEELRYFRIFSTPSDRSYDLDRSPARLARFISRFSWAATCWATTVGLGFRTPPAVPMPLVLERFKARNYGSPEGPPRVLWARPMLWKLSKQFRYRLDFLQTPQVSTISFDFKSLF